MVLQYYVVENATGKQIEIDIESATNEDLTSTKEKWQSDWTSEFIRDPKLEKYAAKTDAGEIVALGAYREDDHGISVFIANIEAHPESNPTISTVRKYAGIGRMMIAYGIQLSIDSGHGGIVTFEAKTDELYDHYIKDFHAVPIFQPHSGGPKLLMLQAGLLLHFPQQTVLRAFKPLKLSAYTDPFVVVVVVLLFDAVQHQVGIVPFQIAQRGAENGKFRVHEGS